MFFKFDQVAFWQFPDNFAIPSKASGHNLYNRYGSSGILFNSSKFSHYVYEAEFGSYAFNGLDLTPESGPRRPFNFFGMVTQVLQMYNFIFWIG